MPRLSALSFFILNLAALAVRAQILEPTPVAAPSFDVGTCDDVDTAGSVCRPSAHQLAKRQDPPAASSSSIQIPQDAPLGGITMTQPAATAQATFHKIAPDNFITFGWNFTDVIATPTSLTIQAYCSANGFTYPVGPTQGLPGDTTQYAWNPYDYEQGEGAVPLAEASYTLRIFDQRGYAAAPTAGYMRSYAGTIFAMYRPQKYVALADGWTCAACSAALRATPIHPAALATMVAMLGGALLVFCRLQ